MGGYGWSQPSRPQDERWQGAARGKGMSAVARRIDAHSPCPLRPEADSETSIEHLSVQ